MASVALSAQENGIVFSVPLCVQIVSNSRASEISPKRSKHISDSDIAADRYHPKYLSVQDFETNPSPSAHLGPYDIPGQIKKME